MTQSNITDNRNNTNIELTIEDKLARDELIKDIQDIIYALGFERGLPKIKIKTGPTVPPMYEVLKAAIRSLKELDEDIINSAKKQYDGQYDLVRSLLYGTISLGKSNNFEFVRQLDSVIDQPGFVIDKILERVTHLLNNLGNIVNLH